MLALNLDRNEWRSFLDILGKDIKTVRLRSFFPKNHPLKATDHGKKSHADGEWIHRMQSEGRGVYIVVNDGGDTDSEITACRAMFCEWDDREKSWQINAWKELGLPEPSIQIDTGGKSIHNYWILKKAIDPETWKPIQERLLDYADADRALKNPSRVMRLAGTYHMKDNGKQGGMTKIIHNSNKKYSYKDIEACLPTLKQHERVKNSVSFDEFEKAPMDVVEKALFCIPPRKPNTNTYHMYRNILWGLIKACEDAGRSAADAVALMKNHSPEWAGIEQVAYSGGSQINAGSFWYFAKENGFNIPKVIKTFNPENPKEEVTITIDKMQKVDANELFAELENIPKESPNAFRYNVYTQQIQLGTGENAKICEGKRSIER